MLRSQPGTTARSPRSARTALALLIVGLAPGLKGANRTGRPFTGDFAGDLLYATLLDLGFARGSYAARPDDGLTLVDCMITNAVRCVPPREQADAGRDRHLPAVSGEPHRRRMPRLAALLALGRIAHDSTLGGAGLRRAAYPFAHGARHEVRPGLLFFDSFHCSRYNTNTGRLTPQMFRAVLRAIRDLTWAAG